MASVVVGFRYLFGILMGISRGPVDEVIEVKVGDKTAWRGSVTGNADVNIDAPELFGGEDGEGGVQGTLTFLFGGATQTAPNKLSRVLTSPMPGLRGRFTAFFDGMLTAMNPYPKPWAFRVRRALNGWDGGCWYPDKAVITLVRPTSSGETAGSTETTEVTVTETLTVVDVSGELRMTFSPPGTVVTVLSVSRPVFSESGQWLESYDAASGAWSTSAGNAVTTSQTLTSSASGPNAQVTLTPPGPLLRVNSISFETLIGEGGYVPVTYDATSGVFSVSGNVVTILGGYGLFAGDMVTVNYRYQAAGSAPTLPANTIRLNAGFNFFAGEQLQVTYIYSITTTNPGSSTLGTAVIKAMNPAHIVYECLTNREWGRGLPRQVIDDSSFRIAADIFHAEGFGLCMRWTRRDEIKAFIKVVLDHVFANLYVDRRTGKVGIKLIRADYVKSELPLFTSETGLLSIEDADVSSSGTSPLNEVRVVWRDPVTNEERTVRHVNGAARQAAGGVSNNGTFEFPGLPTELLAQRVAKRQLNIASRSLRRFNLTLGRRAYTLIPGSAIRIQDGPRNIRDMVVRVATINYGSSGDRTIKCTVVQDEFGLPSRGLSPLPPKPWVPPNNNACVDEHRVIELPYRSVYRALSTAELNAVDPAAAYLGVMLRQGNPLNTTYDIAVRPDAVETEDWPPNSNYYCGYVPPSV